MPIKLGIDARGSPVLLDDAIRSRTHTHIIGSSGTGKSKALEWMIRQDIHNGQGLCLIDWHGALFNDVLRWCAHNSVGLYDDFRSVVIIDPAHPDFITGFNPFMNEGMDVATQVARRISATIKPWGEANTNNTPTFERICRLIYSFAVEARETLPNAAHLLDFKNHALREYAISQIEDGYIRRQWQQFQRIKNIDEWDKHVLSTENRLARFLGSKTIRRFMGLPMGNLDVLGAMEEGKIVLINLADTGFLARDEARVFACLLLNQFFEAAMHRADGLDCGEKAKPFILYLDEFQEYISDDLAAMLDQVRKGGLHLVLAHQHFGHFVENPRLKKSVITNARIRLVFGGLDYEDSLLLANEMFLPDLNTRQIKKAYYHTIHLYEEQTRTAHSKTVGRSETEGSGSSHNRSASNSRGNTSSESEARAGDDPELGPRTEGWFTEGTAQSESSGISEADGEGWSSSSSSSESESFTESTSTVFVPIPVQELGSETEWSLEEKRSKVAELLKTQQQRHCFVKIDTQKTEPLLIDRLRDFYLTREEVQQYKLEAFAEQQAISAAAADQHLLEDEQRFLNVVQAERAYEPQDSPTLEDKKPKAVRSKRKSPLEELVGKE